MKKLHCFILLVILVALIGFLYVTRTSPKVMVFQIHKMATVGSETIKDPAKINKWLQFHKDVEKISTVIPNSEFSFDKVVFQVQYNDGSKKNPYTFLYDIMYTDSFVLVRDSDQMICYKVPIGVFDAYMLSKGLLVLR